MFKSIGETLRPTTNSFKLLVIQRAAHNRKPRWVPVAKSKIYKIPVRPQISIEEKLELQRVNNNYKTQMRAIRRFYYDELQREERSLRSATSEEMMRLEAEEWTRCETVNAHWNETVRHAREQRRLQRQKEMEERALERIEATDAELRRRLEHAASLIKKEKELSKTFITADNLDAAIEHAMANPISYNFAIDLQGQHYTESDSTKHSASPVPPESTNEKKEQPSV
ncbi:Probable 28S ribosomal protein S26, mitochondrial [Eumeta japonica]|uniref:Small ribosomal subunit protein mS26 n=1 Tax=Eumeta variegata TaxID=151549 RepID=A0A4C1TB00_EUMVA|nr:Probable 28S ribosomal protein S26, mitochondrial [Eumeta japonica]